MEEARDSERFGIMSLAAGPYQWLEREWKWAEQLGFESAWLPDNFSRRGTFEYEVWTLLAALARATTRLRIGTLVTSIVARHPTFLALQVLTADKLSDGRAELGIGVGDAPEDCEVFGLPRWSPRERVDRLEEQLDLLGRLLRGDRVDQQGGYYSAMGAHLPRPVQQPRPPLVVAGEGRRALDLVARFGDRWVTLGGQPIPSEWAPWGGDRLSQEQAVEETRVRIERLRQSCLELARDPGGIRRTVIAWRTEVDPLSSLDAFDHFVGPYREIGIDEFVLFWPPPENLVRREEVSTDRRAPVEKIAAARLGGTRTPR